MVRTVYEVRIGVSTPCSDVVKDRVANHSDRRHVTVEQMAEWHNMSVADVFREQAGVDNVRHQFLELEQLPVVLPDPSKVCGTEAHAGQVEPFWLVAANVTATGDGS